MRRRSAALLLVASLQPPPPAAATFFDDFFGAQSSEWAWTERLGLAFSDDCQESQGLSAIWAWAESWLSGRSGKQRSSHCESKEASCPAGMGVTGMRVRSGHVRKGGNRELYDFSLKCGKKWESGWLGLHFDGVSRKETAVAYGACPDGIFLSGVQVMRGRSEGTNARDYYTFKLRCNADWRSVVGLPFDSLRETRSATCSSGRSVTGVRVHRGFQDWGSIDTYEFQLQCNDLEEDAPVDAAAKLGQASDSSLANILISTLGAEEALQYVQSIFFRDDPPAPLDMNPGAGRSFAVIGAHTVPAATKHTARAKPRSAAAEAQRARQADEL